jgi:D-tyrosyl-tRNA(Tyr) deacylase
MRIVLQRVSAASVDVGGERVAQIGVGLLLLIGIVPGDESIDPAKTARKVSDLRIFEDREGKMNRSLRDIGGEILAVSQFTLCADVDKGRRPSFAGAAPPELASPLFDALVQALREEGMQVQTGVFGAKMSVELTNDGPVTLVLEVAGSAGTG